MLNIQKLSRGRSGHVAVDTESRVVVIDGRKVDLYSREGFEIVSELWLKVGWNEKYCYSFSWAGVPIIQLPEDMIRYQEVVWKLKPDIIIETGIAHGGSLVYSASLCKLVGKSRVIGIDTEIRPINRARIRSHPLDDLITIFEGSSTAPEIVDAVRKTIAPSDTVLVVLDSDHSYRHVMNELSAYAPMVTPGSYIIAADGVMEDLYDAPRGCDAWREDNPARAALDFVLRNPDFAIEEPTWPFNESQLTRRITYWPNAFVKRVR